MVKPERRNYNNSWTAVDWIFSSTKVLFVLVLFVIAALHSCGIIDG